MTRWRTRASSSAKPLARSWISRGAVGLVALALVAVGLAGTVRYLSNFWMFRGFPPPKTRATFAPRARAERFYVASAALGGHRQSVDVYLPPGYRIHPHERYPVMYLSTDFPAGPAHS